MIMKRMIKYVMRRKVNTVGLFISALLIATALCACSDTEQSDYDVTEVSCVYSFGDQDGAELDVFSADGTLTQYEIVPYSDSGINLFEGEIPSDDKCYKKTRTISDDEWNEIINAVKDSSFIDLPEELPEVEANDGSTCYIKVKTSIGDYRSGGYCAGRGSGKKHEQFYSVKKVLMDIIRN